MTAAMLAPLGTLPFVATLWLLVVLGARILEESGAKIAVALKGSPHKPANDIGVRRRNHVRVEPPSCARVEWRAAA